MRKKIYHLATITKWDYIRLWRIARSQSKEFDVEIFARGEFDRKEIDGIIVHGFKGGQSFKERFQRIQAYKKFVLQNPADIIQINAPEMLPLLLSLKSKLNCKAIFDSYEFYPDVLPHAPYAQGLISKPLFHWIAHQKIPDWARKVDLVLTSDAPTARYYRSKEIHSTIELMNFPFKEELQRSIPDRPTNHPELHYGGVLTPERGGAVILDAIEQLHNRNILVRMIFTGPPPSDPSLTPWKETLKKRNLEEYVEHRGYVSLEENFDLMGMAKIAVMPTSISRYRYNIPQKIFYYLGWGVAVISTPLPALTEVIPKNLPGIYYVQENPSDVASTIERILSNWDKTLYEVKQGQKWIQENCLWEPQEEKLMSAIHNLFP